MPKLAERPPLRLGTALWMEDGRPRCVLVSPLPSDPQRVVDLHRVEVARLTRLGEGRPKAMAKVLVPSRLLDLLEAGPRALHRASMALAYAEKWHRRGDLPALLAPSLAEVRMLPCLPDPVEIHGADGRKLDRQKVGGPGAGMGCMPRPSLAAVGWEGAGPAGFCLALEDGQGVVLGAWLNPEMKFDDVLELRVGNHLRTMPMDAWVGLELPNLRPGEVQLLPPPRLRAMQELTAGTAFSLKAPFETLELFLGEELVHPTLQ